MAVKILKAGKPKKLVGGEVYRGSCASCGGEYECYFRDCLISVPEGLAERDVILCPTAGCRSYVVVRQVEDQPGDSFDPAAPAAKPPGGEGETPTGFMDHFEDADGKPYNDGVISGREGRS